MDMERRTLPVWRKRSRQMQFFDAVRVSDTTEREPFAGVFEFNRESRFASLYRPSKYSRERVPAQNNFPPLHAHPCFATGPADTVALQTARVIAPR